MAAAAPRLVLLGRADHDGVSGVRGRPAVHEPLRGRRRTAAAVTDGLQLVDELRVGEQQRHRAERLPPEVLVEAGGDDSRSALGERERGLHDRRLEELHLVDADDVVALRAAVELRHRADGTPRMRIPA